MSSFDANRRCMKLQKPPRLHSPFSFCRQHASRKSVTGESSAYNGRPAYHRLFRFSTAVCASVSHSKRAYTLPIRWSPTLSHTYLGFCQQSPGVGDERLYAHEVQEDAQTLLTRNTSPRRPRQSPPGVPSGSNGRRDRGPGCGTRWGAGWFAKMRA